MCIFHNMMGSWPQWLDKDVRRLRMRFLPNYTFGKVAMFNLVPFDSISLRDCTAKGERFDIMWQRSPCVSTSIEMSRNKRFAQRERSLEGTRLVYVSSVPLSQLWVEDFDPGQ